jgi:hypothetical protein
MSVEEKTIVKMTLEEKTIDKMTLDDMTIDKMTSRHVIFRSTYDLFQ